MTELEVLVETEASVKISAGTLPAVAYFSIGYSARIEQDYPKAIVAFHKAMALQPENAMYPQALGIAYADASDNINAVECFRRCLHLKCQGLNMEIPEENPYFHLGWCLEDIGRLDEAEKSYEDSIKRVPSHYEAYLSLGRLLQSRLKLDEAIKVYQSGLAYCTERNPKMIRRLIMKDIHYNLERARSGLGYEERRPSRDEKEMDIKLMCENKAGGQSD